MTPEHASSMAATDSRHLNHQKRGRPPISTQQSSSVPSTPHQHPRDYRFSSRSPSPAKTLGVNSPHSVVSETVGAQRAPRLGQQLVCKFETGAEIRKRRIIYTEGGNEPLPPPNEEPKKALEPHEDEKLSGDMRELYDRLLPSDESEQRRAQLIQKLETILNEEWPGNDIKVNVFGSSGNLLSSSDSDVDVCITTNEKKLESMHTLATLLHKHGMEKVVCRASAKVPIVKIWDPELQLACDLNVNNPLALENTRMIKTYVQMDDRVRPLAKIIKFWTKRRILNDAAFGGTISSYTWICMILNFLQVRDPQILPSLQKTPESRSISVSGQQSAFADDLAQLRGYGNANKESLGQLLFHFFRHYGYVMDYGDFVVSVKEGRLLSRKEKGWDASNYMDKEARSRLCVEEPFNTGRNLGNSADDYAWTGIHKEIRRAFDLIKDGANLDRCCEQYEFPPEEKPIFQRPTPKPKPILTRSASQSNRTTTGNGSGRGSNSSRSNRNASTQRSGSRRASSGAVYANQRLPYMMSPVGINPADYFAQGRMSTDQLHDQLYKQYQYLQAQQEALRNQLMQQQQTQAQMQAQAQVQAQAQAQAQNRGGDVGASPRSRTFAQSLPSPHSPRMFETPPSTVPLLPGYLYHYPARYPPPSPLSQARSTDESVTGPSSPINTNAIPSSRRGVHRASVTEGSAIPSARSQSQPGRSFPNPLTLQGMVHPGYDVSGAIATSYLLPHTMQTFPPVQTNGGMRHANGIVSPETAMPKEYVGYYVGQSPQLLPQYQAPPLPQVPQLRDHQRNTRRISPELIPSLLPNGQRHQSRSPSPLGNELQDSKLTETQKGSGFQSTPQPVPIRPSPEPRGPLIVNGSYSGGTSQKVVQPDSRQPDSSIAVADSLPADIIPTEQIQQMTLDPIPPYRNGTSSGHAAELPNGHALGHPSVSPNVPQSQQPPAVHISPNARARNQHRLNFSSSEGGIRHATATALDPPLPMTPHNIEPVIMSPIRELQTPSPKVIRSPEMTRAAPHNKIAQAAHMANGKRVENTTCSDAKTAPNTTQPAITSSAAYGQGDISARSQQPLMNTPSNVWQQATSRKNHRKSKSTVGARSSITPKLGVGEPLPASEADRKGG
ncbi:hypothetical protein MBLNU459_g0497t2 [Dothideomycetes sp. NU459]